MTRVAGQDLTVLTDNISCRVVDDRAVLRCRSCGAQDATPTVPRADFLDEVRQFIRRHRPCLFPGVR